MWPEWRTSGAVTEQIIDQTSGEVWSGLDQSSGEVWSTEGMWVLM